MDCIGTKTIRDVIEFKASLWKEKECIVFEDRDRNVVRYTYSQLDTIVNRYANVLRAREITKGDRVIVHMHNSPEYLFSWFALAKIGAVMIPTNILAGPFEMEYFADYSECSAVITEPDFAGLFEDVMSRLPRIRHLMLARTSPRYPNHKLYPRATIMEDAVRESSPELPAINLNNEDDLMILFTSGSTSRPKAVQLTHANAVFAGIFGAHLWKVLPADRHFIVLPLFHVNGQLISVMPTLTAGATLIIAEQFSASRYMEQVRAHRATTSSLVAANVNMILKQPIPQSELDVQHDLRLVMYAIAVPDETWVEFESRFNVRLCDLWGMTETLAATTVNPIDGMMKRNCIGMARPGNEVKIVDEHGIEVRPNTVGEIVVKGVPGRTIMKGYYKNPVATAETVKDGWLHTGDNAYMDEDV